MNFKLVSNDFKLIDVAGLDVSTPCFYRDLMLVFEAGGPPAENVYIFNGDFVDRGEYGLELLITLICYAIIYPDSFILNRGNHEDSAVNVRYSRDESFLFNVIIFSKEHQSSCFYF